MLSSIVLSCPKCGASLDEPAIKKKVCSYCDSRFLFSSIHNLSQFDRPLLDRHLARLSQAIKDNPNDCDSLLSLSICYLNIRMFDLAHAFLEKARALKPEDPSISFYLAVSLFQGRRPFKSKAATVELAEKLLTTCVLLDCTDGKYPYILAIIKQDYYVRNGLRCNGMSPQTLIEEARTKYIDMDEIKASLKILDCEEYTDR